MKILTSGLVKEEGFKSELSTCSTGGESWRGRVSAGLFFLLIEGCHYLIDCSICDTGTSGFKSLGISVRIGKFGQSISLYLPRQFYGDIIL